MKQLAGVLLAALLLVGCGNNQTQTTTATTGGGGSSPTTSPTSSPTTSPANDVVVTITGVANTTAGGFPANVTQFRVTLLQSNTTTVVNRQSIPRPAQNPLVVTFRDLTAGTSYVVASEALGATGQSISYNIQGVTAPGVVTASDTNFTAGALPVAPFPVPSPSPRVSPSPGTSPAASPSTGSSPAASPRISPSPGPAPSASVSLPATPSPSPR